MPQPRHGRNCLRRNRMSSTVRSPTASPPMASSSADPWLPATSWATNPHSILSPWYGRSRTTATTGCMRCCHIPRWTSWEKCRSMPPPLPSATTDRRPSDSWWTTADSIPSHSFTAKTLKASGATASPIPNSSTMPKPWRRSPNLQAPRRNTPMPQNTWTMPHARLTRLPSMPITRPSTTITMA